MRESYPGINPSITSWKGQEIVDFQEDLRIRINAHISEKWFYTHMKTDGSGIPRIDMLNLLSRYVGYANWDDFVFRNKDFSPPGVRSSRIRMNANSFFIIVPAVTLAGALLFYLLFLVFNTREYQFCFCDAYTREPITTATIGVTILLEDEDPKEYNTDSAGCLKLRTDQNKIRLVVRSPYYYSDTITRIVRKLDQNETVFLESNDYALIIHYFSEMKVDDWAKRRKNLEDMIDDDALISQVIGSGKTNGIALLNKEEFIDKMTMPTGSLKHLDVLETKIRGNKIMVLRFRIKDTIR